MNNQYEFLSATAKKYVMHDQYNPLSATAKRYIEDLAEHIKLHREKLETFYGVIHASELKEWKRSFEKPFEFGYLNPSNFIGKHRQILIRERFIPNSDDPDEVFGKREYLTRNSQFFNEMYYAEFSMAKSASILKKLKKVAPDNSTELDALMIMLACAEELNQINTEVKALETLPGKRPALEDWQKKIEPDKFTCSCYFRRQAKNPLNREMMADHGFIKAGYRKGICEGAKFAPLEETTAGNDWFLEVARQRLKSGIKHLAYDIINCQNEKTRHVLVANIHAEARDINFRKFLNEGIEYAGSYQDFVEDKVYLLKNQKRYGVWLYRKNP